jgi:hypothetical protein
LAVETTATDAQQEFRKVAEGFDYARTVNWILMRAMSLPRGSKERVHAAEDLHDILWSKHDDAYSADLALLKDELTPDGRGTLRHIKHGGFVRVPGTAHRKVIDDLEGYASGLIRAEIALMDRHGLLGKTTIEENF